MASVALQQKMKSLSRYVKAYLKVYFDATPITLSATDIIDYHLLEELFTEGDVLTGQVSLNSLELSLVNGDGRFTLTNTTSPYYQKLKAGIKVELWHSTEVTSGVFEDTLMGTYYTAEWKPDAALGEAHVQCYDKLYKIAGVDTPLLPIMYNANFQNIFIAFFTALGLTASDYEFKVSLTDLIVPVVWFPRDTALVVLQYLCEASQTVVYVNRAGKIVVDSLINTGTTTSDTMTDSDLVCSASMPQSSLINYSAVNIPYTSIAIKESTVIASLGNTAVIQGNQTIQLEFTSGPILNVNSIRLVDTQYVSIVDVRYDAWQMEIDINATAATTIGNIIVTGNPMLITTTDVEVSDAAQVASIGLKTYEIRNHLIQDKFKAQTWANNMLNILTKTGFIVNIDTRQNILWSIGDKWQVNDTVDKLNCGIIIVKNEIIYDGALDGTIVGIDLSAVNMGG